MTFVGRRIREMRKRRGMSQTELARRLGHPSSSKLNNWENGTHAPKDWEQILPKIAAILHCRVADLLPTRRRSREPGMRMLRLQQQMRSTARNAARESKADILTRYFVSWQEPSLSEARSVARYIDMFQTPHHSVRDEC